MNVNRILLITSVVIFVLVALSAFSTDLNLNETGWLALGLACYAASSLNMAPVRSFGPASRRRVRSGL